MKPQTLECNDSKYNSHEGVKHTLIISLHEPSVTRVSFIFYRVTNNFKLCPRDEIKSPNSHIHEKGISMDLNQDLIIQEQLIWLVAKSKFAVSGHV